MKNITIRSFLLAFLLLASTTNCGTSASLLNAGSTLMTTLSKNPTLTQFASLLKTPGLDKLLDSVLKGKFTMLAPTNDALKNIGNDMLGKLTNPANVSDLANLVKDHIVPGKLNPSDLVKGGLKTASGKTLNLSGVNMGSAMSNENFNVIPVDKVLP